MPKNSRPDIQVLKDRVTRLKAQLREYSELRLYSVTKRKLNSVSEELAECIEIINSIITSDINNIGYDTMSSLDEGCQVVSISEFSSESDLSDSIFSLTSQPKYSSKEIVSIHAKRIAECEQTLGYVTGVIQINQFIQILNSWYQNRFTPEKRNQSFYFKAARIPEWIDLLILSAGYEINQGTFPAFVDDMHKWISDLNTDKDGNWVLPYRVSKLKQMIPKGQGATLEAVLIELIVKGKLYDSEFYPDRLRSVSRIVIENSGFSADSLKVDNIIRSCPRLITTSSFNIAKYQEG